MNRDVENGGVDSEPWFIRRKSWHSDSPSIFISSASDEEDVDEEDGECQSDVMEHDNDGDTNGQLSAAFQQSCLHTPMQYVLGSPRTPRSSTPRTPMVECPGAPSIRTLRSKEILRQSSLSETKLLMTTQLKRTYSIFLFDKHFDYIREVGRGSSSKVFEARDKRNGGLCAVKISRHPFVAREDRERFLREIQSVACLPEHPNVVKYYRGWQQDAHFHIQMELCDSGSLRTYLDSLNQPLDENKIWCFIHQVAAGLNHIHSHGVLHLDIKPENILLTSEGTLKICDFGLAVQKQNLWDWEEGDGGYVAPELLRDRDPGPEADMFSFGVMLYEWSTGQLLPRPNPEVEIKMNFEPTRSIALNSLVDALLKLEPGQRPSACQVLNWSTS